MAHHGPYLLVALDHCQNQHEIQICVSDPKDTRDKVTTEVLTDILKLTPAPRFTQHLWLLLDLLIPPLTLNLSSMGVGVGHGDPFLSSSF